MLTLKLRLPKSARNTCVFALFNIVSSVYVASRIGYQLSSSWFPRFVNPTERRFEVATELLKVARVYLVRFCFQIHFWQEPMFTASLSSV